MSNRTTKTMPREPQIILPNQPQMIPVIDFDGRTWPANNGMIVMLVEMAHRAKRGDESAAAVLNEFGVVLQDMKGYQYWPPVEETAVQQMDGTAPVCGES